MTDRQAGLADFGGVEKSSKRGVENSVKGGKSGGSNHPATPAEERLLALLEKGVTLKKAAKELRISLSRVYTLRDRLVKKGGLKMGLKNVTSPEIQPPRADARYRVHGVLVTVPVRHKTEGYLRRMRQSNVRYYDGHRVTLGPRFVKVRGSESLMFWGISPEDSQAQAEEWVERFLSMLEGRLDTVLLKPGSGFEFFYHHAEVKNGIAEEARVRKERIVVRGENGKVWLITDNSFNLDEMETVESRAAGEDMERVVAPVMNDYREHAHLLRLPSESWAMADNLTARLLETTDLLRFMAERQAKTEERVSALFQMEADRLRKASDELEKRLGQVQPQVQDSDLSELRRYTG